MFDNESRERFALVGSRTYLPQICSRFGFLLAKATDGFAFRDAQDAGCVPGRVDVAAAAAGVAECVFFMGSRGGHDGHFLCVRGRCMCM